MDKSGPNNRSTKVLVPLTLHKQKATNIFAKYPVNITRKCHIELEEAV